MNTIPVFLAGLFLTIGVVSITLRYLNGPLQAILTDLCGTNDRARFWTAFSNVILFLVPLVVALDHWSAAYTWDTAVFEIKNQLETATIGFVASVLFLGLILSRYIPRTRSVAPTKQAEGN